MKILLSILYGVSLGVAMGNVLIGAEKYIFTTKPRIKRLILEEVVLFSIAIIILIVKKTLF